MQITDHIYHSCVSTCSVVVPQCLHISEKMDGPDVWWSSPKYSQLAESCHPKLGVFNICVCVLVVVLKLIHVCWWQWWCAGGSISISIKC